MEVKPKSIIRTKRRTLSILINADGDLIVRAPLKMSQERIDNFLKSKEKWIESKIKLVKSEKNSFPRLQIVDGENLFFVGSHLEIVLTDNKNVEIIDDKIFIPIVNKRVKLIAFLKRQAKLMLQKYVSELAEKFGFTFNKISITSAKTRWGSCNRNNDLCFSFFLIMCNKNVIEYVAAHELSHTREKNHGVKFWKTVEAVCPFYREAESYLKQHRALVNVL